MSSTFPRIATLVLALSACTASQVPVGTNAGELGSSGSDSGSQGPCEAAVVPTIACASGPTVQTCDTSTTPPSWNVTCASGSGGQSVPENLCGDMPVDLIGCASGEPSYICDGAGAAPHWTIACHGTIGVPNVDAGSSGSTVGSDSGTTACDALPVDTIGCPSGEPVYTCVVDSGAPHWNIGCP